MEYAKGIQLHAVWPRMDTHQRMLCIKALTKMVQQMTELKFPAFGGIYFAGSTLELPHKADLDRDFCIGIHTATRFWDCDPSSPCSYNRKPPNRGPWTNVIDYASALIDAGIAQLPDDSHGGNDRLPYHGSVDEHLQLLALCRRILTEELPNAPPVRNASEPTLYHPNLHARNIFVSEEDPSEITAIIDWQSTNIEPAFSYRSEEPDMIDSSMRDAQGSGIIPNVTEETEDSESQVKREKDLEICQKTWATGLRAWSPTLFAAKISNENYFRLFQFVSNTWSLGVGAIGQELLELAQQRKQLGLPGECVYRPSEEELLRYKKSYEDFEVRQRLKLWLQQSLDSNGDGWCPAEAFAEAEAAHKVAFHAWMDSNREESQAGNIEATEERARKLWPWDGNGELDR